MKFLLPLLSVFACLALQARADIESEVLREMNFARTNPQAYARIVAERGNPGDRDTAEAVRFLQKRQPMAPFQHSSGLSLGAQDHVSQQGASGGRGHGNCFGRIERYGNWVGSAGENIYYGQRDARGIVVALIIDKGVSGRGHRKNIFSNAFLVAGIAHGRHARYGSMCVIDFATRFVERNSSLASL